MLESIKNNRIQYQRLTEQEKQDRQILGTLVGPCADIINPTRNGRTYSEELWEKVFNAPLVKEQLNAGGIFGELEHPEYDNVNPEKIAIVMPEAPKKGSDGLLYGYWHILNTPCGKILKTLVDYGYKPGISTRGNGEIVSDYNGNESVNPDTYQLNALDVVLVPAVEKARLDLVESLDNSKSLKESLSELMKNSSDKEKKIMDESLAQLNITLTSENTGEAKEVSIPVDVETDKDGNIAISETKEIDDNGEAVPEVTIDAAVVYDAQSEVETQVENEDNSAITSDDNIEVNDDEESVGDAEVSVITDLQESLKQNSKLKAANEKLQNSLSVSIAKEQQLNEELSRCKKKIAELVESQKRIVGLEARANKFEADNRNISESMKKINSQNNKLNRTVVLQKVNMHQLQSQNERMESKFNKHISSLQEKVNQLDDENKFIQKEYAAKVNDNISEAKQLKESFYKGIKELKAVNEKLNQSNQALDEKLQQMTEAYAKLKCQISGVDYRSIKESIDNASPETINKLTESYSARRLIENSLPFSKNEVKKIRYTRPSQGDYNPSNPDDIYN